jgi:acetyl esterase
MELSPHLEPGTRRFLEQLAASGGRPIYRLSPVEARKVLSDLQAGEDVEKLPADLQDTSAGGVSVRIVRPKGTTGPLPVLMHFHGGGWVLGDKETHDRLAREFANGARAAVVFVNYSPAPEARYPTQIEEAYRATKWIAENGDSLGLDPSRLVLLGDSVGGNMATVVAAMARDRGGPEIAFQILFHPVTDANFDTGSYREFAQGYFLEREGMKWFWDCYLPDAARRREPYASPLQASPEQLKGLPPALVMVGEHDVLRDEVEAYAHKLAAAGVETAAARFLGTMHDFVLHDPIAHTPAPREAIRVATDKLRQIFGAGEGAEARPGAEPGSEAPAPLH